jgi:hypothetical protein
VGSLRPGPARRSGPESQFPSSTGPNRLSAGFCGFSSLLNWGPAAVPNCGLGKAPPLPLSIEHPLVGVTGRDRPRDLRGHLPPLVPFQDGHVVTV